MPMPVTSSASPPRSLTLPPPVLPLRRVPPLARRLRGRGRRRLDDREGRARRRLLRGREDEVEGPPFGHCFRGGVELAREVLGRWRDGGGEWGEEREVERGHVLPGGRRAAEQWTGEGVPSCAAAGGARHRPSERGREEKREEDVPCSASPDCARTHDPSTRASSREQCPPGTGATRAGREHPGVSGVQCGRASFRGRGSDKRRREPEEKGRRRSRAGQEKGRRAKRRVRPGGRARSGGGARREKEVQLLRETQLASRGFLVWWDVSANVRRKRE